MSLDFLQQQVSTTFGTSGSVTSLQTKLQWAAPTSIVGESKLSLDFPTMKITLKEEIAPTREESEATLMPASVTRLLQGAHPRVGRGAARSIPGRQILLHDEFVVLITF